MLNHDNALATCSYRYLLSGDELTAVNYWAGMYAAGSERDVPAARRALAEQAIRRTRGCVLYARAVGLAE